MSKIVKSAIAFSALLGFAAIQPAVVSFAASPNTINNQTAELVSPVRSDLGGAVAGQGSLAYSGTGVYDNYDSYRGSNGFPLPGNAQLFEPID